jgi:plastocyanin
MKPTRHLLQITRIPLVVLTALSLAAPAPALIYTVYMTEYGFDPAYQEIQPGDTIRWVNIDGWGDSHSTASTQGLWNSGEVPYGYYVDLSFPYAGTYPYRDQYTGDTGTIVVMAPAPPPPPRLISPVHLANGTFQCIVTNLLIGKTSIVQASTNLVNWSGVYTNVASDYSYPYTDTGAAPFGRRFYRALALP